MRKICVLGVITTVLLSAGLCPAAGFKSGDVIVVSLPFGDDLYVAGGKVVVAEPVAGDLLAAGGNMILNGSVGGDLQIAGGSLILNSAVEDDVRAVGGEIVFTSTAGGDLIAYGGDVTIPTGAVVNGDVVVGAGNLHLGGTVRGNLRVHAGSLDLSGTVLGDANLYGTDKVHLKGRIEGETVLVGREIELAPGASFGKGVTYWRKDGEMDFGLAPVGGQLRFDPELMIKEKAELPFPSERQVKRGLAAAMGGLFIGTFLSGIVVIVLAILLMKGVFREAGDVLYRSYLKSTGVGFLVLLLLPLVGFLALITVVGIPLGMLILVIFAFSLLFGRVITAVAFAAWIERRRSAEWGTGRLLLVSIGLFAAIKLVSLAPFIGWLVVLFVVCAGYGSLVLSLWRTRSG
jgi:hypothetical protein